MTRQGLNLTLSYTDSATHAYRLRCKSLTHGFMMISDESQGRATKAFYPHRTAPSQFACAVDIMGKDERISLNTYLMGYANSVLSQDSAGAKIPVMTVSLPSRNFLREGVLCQGWGWGTRTGEMVWTHNLVFETSREPIDWDAKHPATFVQTDLANVRDEATKYFYPTGVQLSGTDSPVSGVAAASNAVVSGIATALDSLNWLADGGE